MEQILAKTTLAEAIAHAKPKMEDTQNEIDKGAILLTGWLVEHPNNWNAIKALPDTSIAKVLKDSDSERGKKICNGGSIVQISTEKFGKGKIFSGKFMTDDVKVLDYIAVGSTGDLVERSPARFCGVVTGRNSYSNVNGGTTHGVRVVGMFDLPENKK